MSLVVSEDEEWFNNNKLWSYFHWLFKDEVLKVIKRVRSLCHVWCWYYAATQVWLQKSSCRKLSIRGSKQPPGNGKEAAQTIRQFYVWSEPSNTYQQQCFPQRHSIFKSLLIYILCDISGIFSLPAYLSSSTNSLFEGSYFARKSSVEVTRKSNFF